MTEQDFNLEQSDLEVKFRTKGAGTPNSRSKHQTFGRGRSKTPQQFNGIHRRRRKKIRW
jgi:hypothetical protein